MFKVALIVCLLSLTGCEKSRKPEWSSYELPGTQSEQITGISAIIAKYKTPPSAILDAHFVEEQIGDGVLGPSNFRAFYFLKVAPEDISRWTVILSPLDETAGYTKPRKSRDWWVTPDTFASLKFYKPVVLTGRNNGWIGVSEKTGYVYIFTFTM